MSDSSGQRPSEHWLLDRATGRRRLDADAIVARAHDLVHEGGSAALSMRPLAASLGTSTSALYRRFPSKEWLLIAIVDHVLAEVDTSISSDASPRSCLEDLSTSLRRVLAEHPHLHEILTSRVTITPSTITIADAAFGCLRKMGIGDADLVDAYNAWAGYVIGFTVIETKPEGCAPEAELEASMRRQLDRIETGPGAPLADVLDDAANRAFGLRWQPGRLGAAQTSFEWGLDALLSGFENGQGT